MNTYRIAFLDLLCCFVMVLLLMVNPVKDPNNVLKPAGTLFITTTWIDNGNKNDVDTWMIGPKMGKPIGYDNKDSVLCNLVRDDLGTSGVTGAGNFENIFCRDTPDGNYQINLHAYQLTDIPMEVTVDISMLVEGKIVLLYTQKVTLYHNKDEVTVINFKMDNNKVIPESVNYVFKPLHGAR